MLKVLLQLDGLPALLIFILSIGSVSVCAQNNREISLPDIFKNGLFRQKYVNGQRPLKDGKSYASIIKDPANGLNKVVRNRYVDGKVSGTIYSQSEVITGKDTLDISTEFSDDEKKVLLTEGREEIYRRSSKAWYYIYDLVTKQVKPLSSRGKQLFPNFSPDATKIAYVIDNDIFIKDLITDKETQITTDGLKNKIINGRCDWVYEEEFSFALAFSWSPDGKNLAYYKFDESEVPEYSMAMYGTAYPTQYTYKYPRAGEKNAVVSIHIYKLNDKKTIKIETGAEKDQYIPRVKWTGNAGTLCVLRLNRHQNKLDYLMVNSEDGSSKVILTERDKYYIDIEKEQLQFLKDGNRFVNVSERDGYNHIYVYGTNGKVINQVTKGNWEVTQLYGIDESKGLIYYQSTEASPLRRDVYVTSFNGSYKKRLSISSGTNAAEFSTDFSYYILYNSNINTPLKITLHTQNGEQVRVLEDNASLKQTLEQYSAPSAELFNFKTSEGVSLNGFMIKPPKFDVSKKYPVLMYVYGGPGHQAVADAWGTSRDIWFRMLAQKGYIVACVDNRGTGYRGAEFKKMTYKQLGKYETIDQIEVAKWFGNQSYVDKNRIGIWGWSFGGYVSSLCATKGNGIFAMAMAVAPVVTWRFYDSIYTERFLQTPQENPSGYDDNSPVQFAKNLKGKFLLVHGTGDDNVHFQNSVVFSEALIQANIPFEQAYYPNKNHGIYGGNTSLHLYSKLTDFILKNL